MPEVRVEEKYQKVDEALSDGLTFDPKHVQNYYVNNIIQRSLSYLLGWDVTANKPVKLSATENGLLKVSAQPAVFQYNDTKTGNAPDTWSAPIVFDQVVSRLDIWIFDNPALIQRSLDGVIFQDAIEVAANTMYSIDATTHSFRIMNKTATFIARYQVIGWY